DADAERLAADVLQVQLCDHAEAPRDARLSQRLLLHSGYRDQLQRAFDNRTESRRQPDAEPGLYRRALRQDFHRSAVVRLLSAQLERPAGRRCAQRADTL